MKSLIDEVLSDAPLDIQDGRLPLRPRLLRELVVAKTDEGLIIDGSSQLHVLWGPAAKKVLASLIPLMDGTRRIEEIANDFPTISIQEIREHLQSLCSWGLVEEGPEDGHDSHYNEETLSFFRRYSGGVTTGLSGSQACARLAESEVVIVSSERDRDAGIHLANSLKNTGLGRVSWCDWTLADCERFSGGSSNFLPVAICLEGEENECLIELDRVCDAAGFRWLRVVLDPERSFADIGPLFHPNEICFGCFHQIHSRAHLHGDASLNSRTSSDKTFWACMAAAEITYILSGVGSPRSKNGFRRYNLKDWTSQTLFFAAVPGCTNCRPFHLGRSGQLDVSILFEDYLAKRPQPALPTGTVSLSQDAFPELMKQGKSLTNSPRHGLPVWVPDLDTPILTSTPVHSGLRARLSLPEMGALLLMTAGLRHSRRNSGMPKRWAATAGNLGSVEIFAAARNVEGLSPGYYFYQHQEHTLASFRSHRGSLTIEDFMRRVTAADPPILPDSLLLFTAAYHRLSTKYGPFAYRLTYLDAGVAASQLRMVARSLGLIARLEHYWADDLVEDQLALEPIAEQVTAVVSLHGDPASAAGSLRTGGRVGQALPSSIKDVGAFCDLTLFDLVPMVYRESRMTEAQLWSLPSPIPEEMKQLPRYAQPALPLPAVSRKGISLGNVLKARRSVRYFQNDPVPLEALSAMLLFAHREDLDEWREQNSSGLHLRFVVLAQHVEDLESGVYEYDPLKHSVHAIRGPLSRIELLNLYVQREFAEAPLAIWITVNLAAVCASYGALGHRQSLLRAGAAGNRLWAASSAMQLGGTIVAGVVGGAARDVLGLDGFTQNALLAVALGRSAQGNDKELD